MNTNKQIVRECRVGGQGLIAGRSYVIDELHAEIIAYDMVKTHGVVTGYDLEPTVVTNMHIAFDIDDLLDDVRVI